MTKTTSLDSPRVAPSGDRRRATRVQPGPLRIGLDPSCQGALLDISEGGALVSLQTEQIPARKVTLQLEWREETVLLPSRVVRSIPRAVQSGTEYDVAFEFLDLTPAAAALLRQVIQDTLLKIACTTV